MDNKDNRPSWESLLETAVEQPGTMEAGFRAFHAYSFGNVLLAWSQCSKRGLKLGPIATYPKWKELGRQVRKGEKALMLCQPVSFKKEVETEAGSEEQTRTGFVYRNNWFVMGQTEGKEYELPAMPEWKRESALAALQIEEVPFESMNGNTQGYARGRKLAINPVATDVAATFFHELAHIVLGHTDKEAMAHDETLPRNMQEVEAEAVALLCIASLGLGDTSNQRGYIQNWYKGNRIPEVNAKRIIQAADTILKAGKAVN